jgi:putative ABC transport system substrate-binding protein
MASRLPAVLAAIALCAASFALQAQSAKALRVGVLAGGGPAFENGFPSFRQRLRELGYQEGKGLVIEVRNAQGRSERYAPLSAELVGLKVDVIVVQGNAALFALKQATQTIPIVMANIGDPVGAGFVTSLTRPGGNITGVSNMAEGVSAKWLQLLKEAAPRITSVGVLWDPKNVAHGTMWKEAEDASRALAVTLQAVPMRGRDDLAGVASAITTQKVGALIILPHPAAGANLQRLAELVAEHHLPAVYLNPEFAAMGGLMSYGPSSVELWRRSAEYVDRIARGAKAADLPVDQPTKFALVINRKAATALGLTLPASLLARAEEILD